LKSKKLLTKAPSKAVAYIRVSSDEQADFGISLDAQATKLHAYAQVKGFELAAVISDPAVSGHMPLGERAGGRRLLDLVEAGTVEHVLAVKLDRLFRNALNCLQLVEVWTRQGVGLHILDMGGNAVDTSSAMGKMFLTMAAGFAEMERNLIAERTKAALERKRERGERLGGHLPYGYEVAAGSKRLLESATDKKLLARARRLQRAGMSVRAIAAKLASEGYVTRRGRPMTKSTVGNLLKG
jgi:DNA invertase Pin-like site-specific DNA recombinase